MGEISKNVYGKALYDLSIDENNSDELYEDIAQLDKILNENYDLYKLIKSPKFNEKKKLIKDIFENKVNNLLLNFLYYVTDVGREEYILEMLTTYMECYKEDKNIVDVYVTSSIPLTENQKNKIIEFINKKTNKNINVINRLDEKVISGIKVRYGDNVVDDTAATKLLQIKQQLKNISID